jgi:hypothetical protein
MGILPFMLKITNTLKTLNAVKERAISMKIFRVMYEEQIKFRGHFKGFINDSSF